MRRIRNFCSKTLNAITDSFGFSPHKLPVELRVPITMLNNIDKLNKLSMEHLSFLVFVLTLFC